MKRYVAAGLLVALVLFPMFGYVYARGCQDGVARYKRSKSFMLTLYSMYKFGVREGYDACKEKRNK